MVTRLLFLHVRLPHSDGWLRINRNIQFINALDFFFFQIWRQVFYFLESYSVNMFLVAYLSIIQPAGLTPFMLSCLVCCETAQIPQIQETHRSLIKLPAMLNFSLIFPLTEIWQQIGQRQTGIKSPTPHSCPSTPAF